MKINCFFLISAIMVGGCVSFKKELIRSGGRNEAIQNAISDFSNTGGLYKKDSVFSVSFQDTVHTMLLDKGNDGNYKWVSGKIIEGIVSVRIGGASDYKFLLTASTKIGSKGKLPSRFIEKNGKLFYWSDESYSLTEETLAVFRKYNLLEDDQGGLITIPDNPIDDAQQGAHYYFCQKDLSKYKKIITNKGMGYYDPPKLNCNQ